MFFIFRWLFISLRSWGCGSWQMSAQQQPSLSLSSLSLSVSLSLFYRFVFSFFPTCMALSLFPHTFCLSISSLALLCISLELFDSLYRSVHNKKMRLSLKVWILRSYFFHDSLILYMCVSGLWFVLAMALKVEVEDTVLCLDQENWYKLTESVYMHINANVPGCTLAWTVHFCSPAVLWFWVRASGLRELQILVNSAVWVSDSCCLSLSDFCTVKSWRFISGTAVRCFLCPVLRTLFCTHYPFVPIILCRRRFGVFKANGSLEWQKVKTALQIN